MAFTPAPRPSGGQRVGRLLAWCGGVLRCEGALRLRAERNKNKHGRVLPLLGELAAIISRRLETRRLDCESSGRS